MRYLLMLPLLLAITSGCRDERREARPDAAVDTQPSTDVAALESMTACTNAAWQYRIEYPSRWRTNTGEILPACSLFDPDSIRIPRDSELPHDIAVIVQRERVGIGTIAGPQLGSRELSRRDTTVDGRPAVIQELESTGEGLLSPGHRYERYVVDLGGETLVLTSYDLGDPPYAQKRRVLAAMVRTLRFTGS